MKDLPIAARLYVWAVVAAGFLVLLVFHPSTARSTRVNHPSRTARLNSGGLGTGTGRLATGLGAPELDGSGSGMADQQ